VFYAGLRPTRRCEHNLIYAIIGLFVVRDVVRATDVPRPCRHENAHTRKKEPGTSDIVVRAKPSGSGRLSHCLPIGEYRDGAYRVRPDLLEMWGDLSVKDGFLQRSVRPPRFLRPDIFYRWFEDQNVSLVQANNPPTGQPDVVLVHLRQPSTQDLNEKRSDPFWEFGSFGCTGCHERNLLHPDRADRLQGARLGFAQGGPDGMKFVMLTPPIQIFHHTFGCEARWQPAEMPFCYDSAPLLIDHRGRSDFPSLRKHLHGVNRSTWVAAFSSRFRSRCKPLPTKIAEEIQQVHDAMRRQAAPSKLADRYTDALPAIPNKPDTARKRTYRQLLDAANGRKRSRSSCGVGKAKKPTKKRTRRRRC